MTKLGKKTRFSTQRGVALLIVLAGITLLTGVIVEFAFNTNVNYNLSMNSLERVQANYLAQSGFNIAKLILKYDKEAKSLAQKASKSAKKDLQIASLYEMFPLDTALIRGLAQGVNLEGAAEGEAEQTDVVSALAASAASSVLNFPGDFSVTIEEEEAKLNLNAVYALQPKDQSYDRFKNLLYHLLATNEFTGLFDDRYRGAQELAQNIVDFIDKDQIYNEPGGQERGRENVSNNAATAMKNAKLLSTQELMQVPGMDEKIFQKLNKYVTVYGKDSKLDICRAEIPLIKATLITYTENNPKMEPIKDDNEELLEKLVELVQDTCPSTQSLTQLIDEVLGVSPEDMAQNTKRRTNIYSQGRRGRGTQNREETQSSPTNSFDDFITNQSEIFTVTSQGKIGETEVKLTAVLDTSGGNPKKWKTLIWKND